MRMFEDFLSKQELIHFLFWTQKLLQILGHRYQKDFQWVRLAHLGSGMFGHCHMAMDYSSEYHFCIKKVRATMSLSCHLHSYTIWQVLGFSTCTHFPLCSGEYQSREKNAIA